MSTIFSRIISGEIPSYRIYADEFTYAFLDIHPLQGGHTLIIPRIEVDHFGDVPEPYYSAIFQTAKLLAPAIQKATGCTRVCTLFAGYEIPHCHYHLIPTNSMDDIHHGTSEIWDHKRLQQMQSLILSYLAS